MPKRKNPKRTREEEDDTRLAKVTFHFREGVAREEQGAALCLFCRAVEAIEVDFEPFDQGQPLAIKVPDIIN